MNEIVPIISIVVALVSLAGVLYAFAFWRGKVEKQLSDYGKANITDRLARIETKMEVLWMIYSEQILSNRPNLAMRESKFKLTDEALKAVEEVKQILPNPGSEQLVSEQVLVDLPRQIGLDKLKDIAGRHNMTLGELLAIISVELGIDI